jgi:4-amino-4-deoxy-L-arabinose transferase-like glycosyltransferase
MHQFRIRISHQNIPLMVMSYVGTLKSAIWSMILKVWPPSPASVRIPAVLLGALSVWWTYLLMARILGIRAGLVCAALLATDPVYVLYSRWDQGPSVIQHLCFIGAMLALVRFHQERRTIWLAAGFFAIGLGMWDKAIFIWVMSGLGVAGLVLFWKQIRSALSIRSLAVATAAFILGAAPLIVYNVKEHFETFRGNAVWSTEGIRAKAYMVRYVIEGNALFGFMMRDPWDGPVKEPSTAAEKVVVSIAAATKFPRHSLTGYLAMLSILLLPVVWRTPARQVVLFVLICGLVAWCQMAFTKNAGGAAHHIILLWPLPAMGMAAVLAAASQRMRLGVIPLIAIVSVACVANLLVLSTYYTNLLRNGGTPAWTDAVYSALAAIDKIDKTAVCTVDWGFIDTLRLYEQGRATICAVGDPVNDEVTKDALFQISQPGHVYLSHTEGSESFPGIAARFLQLAQDNGFQAVNRQVFADSNGRNTVQIFELRPVVHNSQKK